MKKCLELFFELPNLLKKICENNSKTDLSSRKEHLGHNISGFGLTDILFTKSFPAPETMLMKG